MMKSVEQIESYRLLTSSEIVAFDIETTGLRIGRDEVLSIAIIDGDGNTLLDSYVRPVRHASWPATQRVNGIKPQDVAGAPTLDKLSGQIVDLLESARLVVGYNSDRYDIPFIEALGVRPRWNDLFDVMTEFSAARSAGRAGARWIKLVECARHYGYTFDAHHAVDDARATMWCFRRLIMEKGYLSAAGRAIRSDAIAW